MEAIAIAEKHGLHAAAKKCGLSVSTIGKWMKEHTNPVDEIIGVSLAVVETQVVDGETLVEGLPPGTTVAYIDPDNVTRMRGLAHLYADRRRSELKVELADAAVDLAQRLRKAEDGKDAAGYAKALGDVVDRLRLESGQVTDLRGHVNLRGQLDQEQMAAVQGGKIGPDLTVPIEARSVEVFDDE
jgi:hypothetical protein